jgi:hypothetical protein
LSNHRHLQAERISPTENKHTVNYYNEETTSSRGQATKWQHIIYLSGSATKKEEISTLPVCRPLSFLLPEHVFMSHSGHHFIIDVQPTFPCVVFSVRVKNIDGIMPAVCRFAVMVEHSIELVMRWL